jgi:hypothetical protein
MEKKDLLVNYRDETLGEEFPFPFCDSKTIRLTIINLGFAMPRLSVR